MVDLEAKLRQSFRLQFEPPLKNLINARAQQSRTDLFPGALNPARAYKKCLETLVPLNNEMQRGCNRVKH